MFALDAGKGLLAALVPRAIPIAAAGPAGLLGYSLAAGLASVLGHVFSPWMRFRGGRGVATSLGVFLGIIPLPTLLAFGIWMLLVALTRRVSAGSIGASLAYPFLVAAFHAGSETGVPLIAASGLVALLVILRHIPNIRRLLAGEEPPVFGGPRGAAS